MFNRYFKKLKNRKANAIYGKQNKVNEKDKSKNQ